MTTVTTRKEQLDTAAAAKKVGGYSELVRLAAESAKHRGNSYIKQDANGRWQVFAGTRG